MKRISLIPLLFLTYFCQGQNLSESIVRNDNDYVTYDDVQSSKVTNPAVVQDKFNHTLQSISYDEKNDNASSYKISVSDSLDVFVLIVYHQMIKNAYVFVYNPTNKNITKDAIRLNLKWANNNEDGFVSKLLSYPLLKVKSSNRICLKERVHNGNVYNAVISKVYSINADLSFSLLYCYESTAITSDNKQIKREVGDNKILTYQINDTSYTYLGSTIVDFDNHRIIEKKCTDKSLCDILFTISGKKDEDVFNEGYKFSY